MKKFSTIAKIQKPADAPTNEVSKSPYFEISNLVESLINEFLHIRIEGPINPILQGTILIDGKQEFTEAIIEMFTLLESKKELKVLESARSRFILNDMQWIENEIKSTEYKINEYQSATQIIKHEEAIKDMYKKAKGDLEELKKIANKKAEKMKDGKRAFYRAMAAEKLSTKMDKKCMMAVAGIFMDKVRQLGYNPQNNYIHTSTKKII